MTPTEVQRLRMANAIDKKGDAAKIAEALREGEKANAALRDKVQDAMVRAEELYKHAPSSMSANESEELEKRIKESRAALRGTMPEDQRVGFDARNAATDKVIDSTWGDCQRRRQNVPDGGVKVCQSG